jgi:hypothetical protein
MRIVTQKSIELSSMLVVTINYTTFTLSSSYYGAFNISPKHSKELAETNRPVNLLE